MKFPQKTAIALAMLGLASAGVQAQMTQQSQQPQQSAPSPGPITPKVQAPLVSPNPPASQSDASGKPAMLALDKDRDGSISRVEAAADPALAKIFDQLDRNHDGKLDEAELAGYSK